MYACGGRSRVPYFEANVGRLNPSATEPRLPLTFVCFSGSGAVAADSNVDDNTIVVEVIISVTPDTSIIADGSTQNFAVAVNYGSSTVTPTVETFTAVHDQSSINGVSCGYSVSITMYGQHHIALCAHHCVHYNLLCLRVYEVRLIN